MKLTAYVIDDFEIALRPAPLGRAWMDATEERFAYRCLPMDIANAYGWEVLCASSFKATWNGDAGMDSIKIDCPNGDRPPVVSHFGSGVLTFHVPCVFRTEAGYDLMVQGPVNRPKDAIAPLSAVVETDWAPYTFTMNWLFTQPEIEVEFEAGEPFCHIFPIRRGEIERFEPKIKPISADPELEARYRAWSESRGRFNDEFRKRDSEARAAGWQKHYHHGADPDFTERAPRDHRTRLTLADFERPSNSVEESDPG